MENINPISILDYLDENAGKSYEKPENASPDKQDNLNQIKSVASKAVNDLNKIANIFENEFDLKIGNRNRSG